MRYFLWIVILIGTPSYIFSGKADGTTILILLGLCGLSIVALYNDWRKIAAAKAQQDFWLNQRK